MVNLSLTTAYLASGLISFTIALYAWQRRNSPGNFQLAGLMLAATVWSLTSAMEWHANALNVKIFWSVVSYLGSQTGPVFFLLFALRYAQQDAWLRPQKIALFFIFPLATFGMAATNSWHHLVWPQINLHVTPNGTTATYLHGPWFWVQIVYAYSLLTWGVIVLLRSILFFPHPYSHQSRFLVLASLAPMAGNIVYAINPAILGGADPTPITFALTGLLLGWAIFRHQLLNIYPIARERLMENLSDGIILIDTLQRVVDVNPSARRMLGEDKAAHPDLISQPITQLLTEWPRLAEKCNENLPGQIELLVDGSQPCYLEVTASRLQNKQAEPIGYLVILHDITKQRQAEQALQRRAQELAALYDTSIDINSQLDLSRLLHAIVERAIALSGAQMGGLYLLRPATQTLELVISYNLPRDFTGTILQPGEGVSGQVAVTGEVLMIPDYTH